MSSILRPGPATYEDLVKLPEHLLGQIVDGDVYPTPRPAGTATPAWRSRNRGGSSAGKLWVRPCLFLVSPKRPLPEISDPFPGRQDTNGFQVKAGSLCRFVLDDDLVNEAARLTGIRTKRSLVDEALRLLVNSNRRK